MTEIIVTSEQTVASGSIYSTQADPVEHSVTVRDDYDGAARFYLETRLAAWELGRELGEALGVEPTRRSKKNQRP